MRRPRAFATDALHLGVLSAFAVTQPLLQLIGDKPAFLAVRGLTVWDMVLWTAMLSLTVPIILVAIEGLVHRLHRPSQRALHVALCGLLVTAIALPPLGRAGTSPWMALGAALALGVGAGLAIDRVRAARLLLLYATPAIVLFPLLFALRPGISTLFRPTESTVTAPALPNANTPIVLVIFDELPVTSLLDDADTVDARHFPHFAALADETTWYRHTATASDFTVLAVPAILTGMRPEPRRLPIASEHPRSIFTLLGERYPINVVESLTHVCPPHLRDATHDTVGRDTSGRDTVGRGLSTLVSDLGLIYLHVLLPAQWARGLPSVSENWMGFNGRDSWREDWNARGRSERISLVERFLDGIVPTDGPTLHVLHVLLPHPPFLFLPSGQAYSNQGDVVGVEKDTLPDDPWALTQIHQRHLLQVGFADRIVGRIRARLEETKLWDRAVVVVTADHGASFEAGHKRRSVGRVNFGDVVPVPLFIKRPGQRAGHLDHRQLSTIDILPTVLDEAGVTSPWPLDGRSMADPTAPGRASVTVVPYRVRATKPRVYQHADLVAQQASARAARDRRFGVGATRQWLRVGPEPWLHGQPVAPLLEPTPAPFGADLRLPPRALDLGPEPTLVPVHVHGRLVAPRHDTMTPRALAVAINGRIAGTTRSWTFAPLHWSAILDPSAFGEGTHELDIYWIRHDADSDARPRLHPVPILQDGLSLIRSAEGLHPPEPWSTGGRIRWTRGDAEIRLFVDPDRPPRALAVTIVATPPGGAAITLSVNGTRLFRGQIEPIDPSTPWRRVLDLETISTPDDIVVQVVSESFVPRELDPNQEDARQLGVALSALEWVEP